MTMLKTIFALGLIAVTANAQNVPVTPLPTVPTVPTIPLPTVPTVPTVPVTPTDPEESASQEQPEDKKMWLEKVLKDNLTLSTDASKVGDAKAKRNDKLNLRYAKKQVFLNWLGKAGKKACSDSS